MRGLFLVPLFALVACDLAEQPELIDWATAAAICSAQALDQGLAIASTEYNVYMAGCLSDILTDIIIDEVIGLEKV